MTATLCPHCGHTAIVETSRACVEGFLSEADYHCAGCTRHVAEFSYGAWQSGTGKAAFGPHLRALDVVLAAQGSAPPETAAIRQVAELHRQSGQPLLACRKAYTAAGGDFEQAEAILAQCRPHRGMLVGHARTPT